MNTTCDQCGEVNPADIHTCTPAAQPAPVQEPVAHPVIAGALFDFMGWLTSRDQRLTLSSTDEASPAVTAITEFAKMRGLSLDDARVQDWQANTTPPAAPVQEPVAWKNAAIRLGEELSSVGPAGYYDMTAEQWLDWAMTQQPRGKNSLPAAQRQWVGLTTDEMKEVADRYHLKPPNVPVAFRAIEAKLKEKNNG